MKRCHSLEIVTNSNGIVRVYGDGGMVFEIQCDYVKVNTFVDCGKAAASGTIPKLRNTEEPKTEKRGRIAVDLDEIPKLSAEERYRLENFNEQPEAKYFNT